MKTIPAATILSILLLLAACAPRAARRQANAGETLCADPGKVADEFYAANDAGDSAASLALLTDDVVLVTWATGANGYHMSPSFAIGKNQVSERLGAPGLRRTAVADGRPNFSEQDRRQEGNTLRFQLLPDRLRQNGRPFNHYSVELVFQGCQIEIIKLVERVTWL